MTAEEANAAQIVGWKEAYEEFKEDNRSFWLAFNGVFFAISVGFAVMNFLTSKYYAPTDNAATNCGVLISSLLPIMALHCVNALVALINLAGCETTICFRHLLYVFILFEFAMLAFMNITYFESQPKSCIMMAPKIYFFVMAQIMTLWGSMAFVMCYFCRKIC